MLPQSPMQTPALHGGPWSQGGGRRCYPDLPQSPALALVQPPCPVIPCYHMDPQKKEQGQVGVCPIALGRRPTGVGSEGVTCKGLQGSAVGRGSVGVCLGLSQAL